MVGPELYLIGCGFCFDVSSEHFFRFLVNLPQLQIAFLLILFGVCTEKNLIGVLSEISL